MAEFKLKFNNLLYNVFSILYLTTYFSPETDLKKMKAGGDDSVQYESVVGLNLKKEEPESDEDEDEEGDEEDEDGSEEEGEREGPKGFVNSRRPRDEDKESKRLRKQAVKGEKAEKRKDKIKKHVKKKKSQSGRNATIK